MRFKDFTWSPDDLICQTKFMQLADNHSATHVFMYTDSIEYDKPIHYRGITRPAIFPPKQRTWITGLSDFTVRKTTIEPFEGLYDRWYGINVAPNLKNIYAVPIGVDTHSDEGVEQKRDQLIYEVSKTTVTPSDKLAYMNFNAYTYLQERGIVDLQFNSKPWVTAQVNKRIPYREYCENVKAHKFTFCPRGNGPDTYRLWESIYLGSIPIVLDYPEMECFFKKLPVLKVRSWDNLTDELLEIEYERIHEADYDFSIMRMGYWTDLICRTS
jgi:hypothetical protein